jgi:glycosyltransferase involved in cell wall biosynthesis
VKPLPLAIDYTSALTQRGGIGRYTRELVAALAALDSETPYVLFAAGYTRANLPSVPAANFSWRPTPITDQWFARLWHRARLPLPIELWTGPLRLLHAPDFTLPPVRRGVPTLLTVHDLSFVRTPETAMPGLRAYLNQVVPRSVHRADHILADSEATRQDVIDLYHVSPGKITVLYSGVEESFGPVTDQAILRDVRQRYQIGDRPYILSVGTVQPRKNYVRLVQALDHLADPDLQLVIAGGKGWLADPLYEQIQLLGLSDRVTLIGFAADADLPALYSGAVAFALPSLYEGFGLPVLEALACGTPVMTSNISSLPEVAGEAAILVDPSSVDEIAEALHRLRDDTQVRERLVALGFQQARRFTWQSAAQQLRRHYQELLNS